jgi:hypothetical protein
MPASTFWLNFSTSIFDLIRGLRANSLTEACDRPDNDSTEVDMGMQKSLSWGSNPWRLSKAQQRR